MSTITCYEYLAKQIENYYIENEFLKIEEIITRVSDYKQILEHVSNYTLNKLAKTFKAKYNYKKSSNESIIDIIVNSINNNKYIMEVDVDIPRDFADGIQNAYFKLSFNISIQDKRNKEDLLNIYGSGNGYHYVCGSSNTEIDKFDVRLYHYCETKEKFNDIVNYLDNNWDIYDKEKGNDSILDSRDYDEVFEILYDSNCFKDNYDGNEKLEGEEDEEDEDDEDDDEEDDKENDK